MVVMFQKELVGDARGVSACAWTRSTAGEDVLLVGRGPWVEAYKVVDRSLVLLCSTRLASFVCELGVGPDDSTMALHLAPCKISVCVIDEGAPAQTLWDLAGDDDEELGSEFDRATVRFAGFAAVASVGRKLAALDLSSHQAATIDYNPRLSVADIEALETSATSAFFVVTFSDAVDAAATLVKGYECLRRQRPNPEQQQRQQQRFDDDAENAQMTDNDDENLEEEDLTFLEVTAAPWFVAEVPGLVFATKLAKKKSNGSFALLCASAHRITIVQGAASQMMDAMVLSVALNPFAGVMDSQGPGLLSSDVNNKKVSFFDDDDEAKAEAVDFTKFV